MAQAQLRIDLGALTENWRALSALSGAAQAAAVVKADAYGLGVMRAGQALAKAGANLFFVAIAEEGAALRKAIGAGPDICIFAGYMDDDAELIRQANLIPMLNSPQQVQAFLADFPGYAYGLQLDSGMNRLGIEADDFVLLKNEAAQARLLMSHLACADEPEHPMNALQLAAFRGMTDGISVPRALSATGGILLGPEYHFDITRPGIGLYGGAPFGDAKPVVTLGLPVIQTRRLKPGESVGYGNSWIAKRDSVIATVSGGYADGLIRAMGSGDLALWAGDARVPVVGRVSMDLITADVTDLDDIPQMLHILTETQTVETLADAAGTIGYEILTSLGARYARNYVGG